LLLIAFALDLLFQTKKMKQVNDMVNDLLKMALSAGWIALVALGSQHFAARSDAELMDQARSIQRQAGYFRDGLNGPADPRIVTAGYASELDSRILHEIREGLLEVTAGGTADPQRAADFVDAAVKTLGIDHVALSSALNEQSGTGITLQLLRRGYRRAELLKLLGGNAQRVLAR
jgi:microsomal dipeptidase-like Zn-dependent dipeptidase